MFERRSIGVRVLLTIFSVAVRLFLLAPFSLVFRTPLARLLSIFCRFMLAYVSFGVFGSYCPCFLSVSVGSCWLSFLSLFCRFLLALGSFRLSAPTCLLFFRFSFGSQWLACFRFSVRSYWLHFVSLFCRFLLALFDSAACRSLLTLFAFALLSVPAGYRFFRCCSVPSSRFCRCLSSIYRNSIEHPSTIY